MQAWLLVAGLVVASVSGHGNIIYPPSRNARDGTLSPAVGHCNTPYTTHNAGYRSSGFGQPCMWFSQGCTIGCDECDNHTQHTQGKALCANPVEPTLPKHAWTMNRWAVPGTVNDSYRFNPWRAPGHAPVVDACGMAGGRHQTDPGGGDAVFTEVPWAKLGDLGTDVLAPGPSQVTWKAGESVEVSWGIRFNHGGGYQYRLCPADEDLTEECFMRHPLDWDKSRMTSLWYNDGREIWIQSTYVSEGVRPAGSTWMMNPIPRIDFDSTSSGQPPAWKGSCDVVNGTPAVGMACRQFDPPCEEGDPPWFPTEPNNPNDVDVQGLCSGDLTAAAIVDHVIIPTSLTPGSYVLGFRWDCEETAQIWSSCSDITIKADDEEECHHMTGEEAPEQSHDEIPSNPDGYHRDGRYHEESSAPMLSVVAVVVHTLILATMHM